MALEKPAHKQRDGVRSASIKQKPQRPGRQGGLPDFRNLGVLLRLLLIVNLLAVGTALFVDGSASLSEQILVILGWVELPLLMVIVVLVAVSPQLRRLPVWAGIPAVLGLVVLVCAVLFHYIAFGEDRLSWRSLLWAATAAAFCLFYFDYRSLRLSPALSEARVMALTARIRPHFLFNTLNGILGVVRTQPQRAEQALEELADLFRALMRENLDLVALGDEIALCQRYIGLEQLRLGERLQVRWKIDPHCNEVAVPPLLLQPLVENAIYHGVEPSSSQGKIVISVMHVRDQLRLMVSNRICALPRVSAGNKMALVNIRERLMLFFDLEATLDIIESGGYYRVLVCLPFRAQVRPHGKKDSKEA